MTANHLQPASVPDIDLVRAEGREVARPSRRPLAILVVDDSADSAEMMKVLLELDGHDVRVGLDGASALEAVADFTPALAFLDINLPDMSGYELASRLRSNPRTHSTFLVALTGLGLDEDRELAREYGFDAFLTKPAAPEEIHRLVEGLAAAG